MRWSGLALAISAVIVAALLFSPVVAASARLLRRASPGWLLAGVVAQLVSMGCYAEMQRRLLIGAGTQVSRRGATAMTYAAHSMSVTLPGGPVFSTAYTFRRMQAMGAESAVAAWCTAAGGLLSTLAFLLLAAVTGAVATVDETDDSITLLVVVGATASSAALGVLVGRHPAWRRLGHRRLDALLGRLPARRRAAAQAARTWIQGLLQVRVAPAALLVAGVLALLNWVADAACLALCCRALDVHVSSVNVALSYLAGMTAASLPIVPGCRGGGQRDDRVAGRTEGARIAGAGCRGPLPPGQPRPDRGDRVAVLAAR